MGCAKTTPGGGIGSLAPRQRRDIAPRRCSLAYLAPVGARTHAMLLMPWGWRNSGARSTGGLEVGPSTRLHFAPKMAQALIPPCHAVCTPLATAFDGEARNQTAGGLTRTVLPCPAL